MKTMISNIRNTNKMKKENNHSLSNNQTNHSADKKNRSMKLRKEKWEKVKIGDVCELINGRAYSANELLSEGTPVLRVGNFFTNDKWYYSDLKLEEKKYCDNDDLLYAWSASFGPRIWKGEKVIFHYHIWKVDVSDKISKQFLYYVLESETDKIKSASHGTTMPHITKTSMEKHLIPLPPLSEQKQIATLFQSIETAMEQVDGQEKKVKELQKNLVNGLMSREPMFGNLLNSKNCIATTFGEIAECDKKYPEHEKEVERFVGLENIEPENFQLQGFGLVANGTTFTKRFTKTDVLFGKRRAYLKKVAVADFDGICSGDILVIRAKANKMLQGLLPYYISADVFIQHAVSTSAGSLSPRTKWKDLETFEIAIPDLKLQEKILEVLQQLDKTVYQLKQQKATLKLLKQKLLNEILS